MLKNFIKNVIALIVFEEYNYFSLRYFIKSFPDIDSQLLILRVSSKLEKVVLYKFIVPYAKLLSFWIKVNKSFKF